MRRAPSFDALPGDDTSSETAAPGLLRAWGAVRAVLTPANLTAGGVLVAGWLALLGWTGAGPQGWQARRCADLDHRPAACGEVVDGKDTGRIVPHTAPAGVSS